MINYILLGLLSCLSANMHNVSMAVFKISEQESTITIEVTFDINDLAETLQIAPEKIDLVVLRDFIDHNSSFKLNEKECKLSLSDFRLVRDHIRCIGDLGQISVPIKILEIKNTCLLNIKGQSNIIMLNLNKTTKDYRMHKSRQVITARY